MSDLKCIDCKFCAFVNHDTKTFKYRATYSDVEIDGYTLKGGFCMKMNMVLDVIKCSMYEKAKHNKKFK